jgi:hypothetical protein
MPALSTLRRYAPSVCEVFDISALRAVSCPIIHSMEKPAATGASTIVRADHMEGQSVEEIEQTDVVELEGDRFISLQSSRRWPMYVVEWSVRRRVGDSDFPLISGKVEKMPPAEGTDLDEIWNDLREEALAQAHSAFEGISTSAEPHQKPSLLGRLFKKR